MQQTISLRKKLYKIIFEADTKAGKLFDIILLWVILLGIVVAMFESVNELKESYKEWFRNLEWFITILFTLEYVARIIVTPKPIKYITSFYGIIDLLSIVPTYLSLFLTGSHYLIVIRTLRLLRIFRILKLSRYVGESRYLMTALKASYRKITVFLGFVLSIVIIMGTLMYLIEGEENGFTSIPKSIYWGIVTLTTVGYGDVAPQTILGQLLASIIMLIGYAIIAVPTGIVTAELTKNKENVKECSNCLHDKHDQDADYCKKCGEKL